ncbi:MAG: hypothetical protein ACXWXC_10430, partial [Aeromicrobium sp.]
MTGFNNAYKKMGELDGSQRVTAVVDHLLRGPGALEDRLTNLIHGGGAGPAVKRLPRQPLDGGSGAPAVNQVR